MKQKNFLVITFSFFLCALFLPFSSALGIAPGKVMLDFSPGAVVEREITLFNTEGRALSLLLEVRGELAPYLTLSSSAVTLQPGENKQVSYTLRLPDQFARPGVYSSMIVAKEQIAQPSSGLAPLAPRIGGILGVGSIIEVHVPYGGRSVAAELFIPRTKPFAPVEFLAHVQNVGTEHIRNLQTAIAIYDLSDELITTLQSEKRPLQEQERATLVSIWEPNILYGEYRAAVTFAYDGRKEELTTDFVVGESVVEMLDVRIEDFVFGSTATIVITLQNTGDLPLSVDGGLRVVDEQGTHHTSLGPQTLELQPHSTGELRFLWPLTKLSVGRYVGKVVFRVQGLQLHRTFHILMTEEGISTAFTPLNTLTGKSIALEPTDDTGSSLSSLWLLIALVLLFQIFFLTIYLRRRQRGNKPQGNNDGLAAATEEKP